MILAWKTPLSKRLRMNLSDVTDKPFYECKYCGKKIVKKATFERHECEKMKRHKICKTRKGISAFNDYKYWLSSKGKQIKNLSTFVDSKYFNSFVQLQTFISEKGVPDRKLFIQYGIDLGISPMLWRNKDFYESFIQYYDTRVDPIVKLKISLKLMSRLSDLLECDITEVFNNLLPTEVARLIFERRLSPWFLLFSKTFKNYLHMIKDPSQHLLITTLIDPMEWKHKFAKDKETVNKIKSMLSGLDL